MAFGILWVGTAPRPDPRAWAGEPNARAKGTKPSQFRRSQFSVVRYSVSICGPHNLAEGRAQRKTFCVSSVPACAIQSGDRETPLNFFSPAIWTTEKKKKKKKK
jgi:hypothetical protein